MRRCVVAALAAVALAGLPAAASSADSAPSAAGKSSISVAHKCGRGYKHAVIGGQHKCLRRGQYCARSRDREYHRYGYHCHKADRNGDYHLE